jgi:hypothetical protein
VLSRSQDGIGFRGDGHGGAHPYKIQSEPVPARPLSASWCGALDLYGNVWEIVTMRDPRVAGDTVTAMIGGSFRHDDGWFLPRPLESVPADDVGFRIAVDA